MQKNIFTHCEMPDFAVSHNTFGQTDIEFRSTQVAVEVFLSCERVHNRRLAVVNSVSLFFG